MNDPTQDRTLIPAIKSEVFTKDLKDDNDNSFTVLVTYHYQEHDGNRHIKDYNYRPVDPVGFVPVMRTECLADDVRDAIQANEGCWVDFQEAMDMVLMDLT